MSQRFLAEFGTLLAVALLAWWLPRLRPASWSWPTRTLRGIARTRRRAILWSAILSFAVCPILSWVRPPSPHIHDEFSYLLAADTFARGRLTNPTHPLWKHLESFHIIHTPTYQSKYPPGQSLFLAAGQVLTGRPIVGVWLSMAAGAAAVCWMLLAWVPPRWALFGALLPVFRFGTLPMWDDYLWFSYWSTSFWGGAVAMAGGALLLGALPRLIRGPRPRDAALFALGLLVLANSRPLEGLVVAPATSLPLAWALVQRPAFRAGVLHAALSGIGVLMLGALAMGYYHYRVTGDPLKMPYQIYREQYEVVPLFTFQPLAAGEPQRHQEIQDYVDWMERAYKRRTERSSELFGLLKEDLTDQPYFFWGYALWLPLLWLATRPWDLWAAFCGGLILLLMAISALTAQPRMQPHYLAPAAPAFVYLAVSGLRRLRTCQLGARRVGRATAEAVIVVSLLSFAVACVLRAQRGVYYPTPLSQYRPQIISKLLASEGDDVVIVSYSPSHNLYEEWVGNGAEPDSEPIIWARDMGSARNRELIEYYDHRHIWRLFADEVPPRLEHYEENPKPGQ